MMESFEVMIGIYGVIMAASITLAAVGSMESRTQKERKKYARRLILSPFWPVMLLTGAGWLIAKGVSQLGTVWKDADFFGKYSGKN